MAGKFSELVKATKDTWSDEVHALHCAASVAFETELQEQQDLGSMLAQARKERHLTQPQLAELSGVQQAEISRIENGHSNPSAETINKIAKPLGFKLALVPAS